MQLQIRPVSAQRLQMHFFEIRAPLRVRLSHVQSEKSPSLCLRAI